jgi:sialate O-acetylesterase
MRKSLRILSVGAIVPLLLAASASANPVPAPVFGDHGVLQCDKPLPVWGRADPGEAVTVTFRGQSAGAVAGADGRWEVRMGPFAATAEPADLTVAGKGTVVFHDVVVGEVWLCSGQSNMEFTVNDPNPSGTYQVRNAAVEVAAANHPLIRQLKVERTVSTKPEADVKTSGWIAASPATVGQFTAVGYFFARDIHRTLGVPVGIIDSPWGGTPVESWMSDAARAGTSLAATLDTRWKRAMADWPPERVARYPADMAAWQKAEADAKVAGLKNTLPWPQPPATTTSPAMPGGLYNAMIAPLEPAALRGILWYQGESNTGHPSEYAELFKAMITSWRAAFGQGDLPFYFVQIANFGDPTELEKRDWAQLREGQAAALSLPATGMAVTVDIGDAQNIHPRNKQEVGRRLALIARAKVYGVAPEVSGPVFLSATREGRSMRVRFTHSGDELEAHGGPPASLEVAGADKVFHPASGTIETDSLLVSSADVPEPVAVRYAWTNAPDANLYSDEGLPAVPFRSDAW